MEKRITARIFRYDPVSDSEPRYEIHDFPYFEGMSVLDALIWIQENRDSTLSFRYECKFWRCGSCGLTVNDVPALACKRRIQMEEPLVIKPLPWHPVIKDLVVDFKRIYARREALGKLFEKKAVLAKEIARVPAAEFQRSIEASHCIACSLCSVACPAFTTDSSTFVGPMYLMSLSQAGHHPLNSIEKTNSAASNGLFNCVTCDACNVVCPMEITVREIAVQNLRDLAYQHGSGPLPRHRALVGNVEKLGNPYGEPPASKTNWARNLDVMLLPARSKRHT